MPQFEHELAFLAAMVECSSLSMNLHLLAAMIECRSLIGHGLVFVSCDG
jgi:hypothetical protein